MSLISLNLTNFDISKVTDMSYMFNNCKKLKYLDISHFSPKNITEIPYMFKNMTSLIYLNIYSLEIKDNTNLSQTFNLLLNDLKICANGTNMQNYLLSQNKRYDCSDICFIKNIKLDIINNSCLNSCEDNGYGFEYNNICYQKCPADTHSILSDSVGVCLDKKPEGYYLDHDGFYKKCFESCENCFGPGNEKDNNCSSCKSNYLFLNDSIYNSNCYEKCPNYYYFNETNDYICTENCSGAFDKLIIEEEKCIDNCKNHSIVCHINYL
jgi:surface protein